MTDRDRLIKIMAEATVVWRWGAPFDGPAHQRQVKHDSEMLRAALDAAEGAGFVIVPPDDGR